MFNNSLVETIIGFLLMVELNLYLLITLPRATITITLGGVYFFNNTICDSTLQNVEYMI